MVTQWNPTLRCTRLKAIIMIVYKDVYKDANLGERSNTEAADFFPSWSTFWIVTPKFTQALKKNIKTLNLLLYECFDASSHQQFLRYGWKYQVKASHWGKFYLGNRVATHIILKSKMNWLFSVGHFPYLPYKHSLKTDQTISPLFLILDVVWITSYTIYLIYLIHTI